MCTSLLRLMNGNVVISLRGAKFHRPQSTLCIFQLREGRFAHRVFTIRFNLLQTIHQAELEVIKSVCEGQYHQIVLCTCSAAGSDRVKEGCNTMQCLVDESGMCLEPETIVPIASSEAKQVVLVGDHMQLQPIVANRVARSLGLKTSLFERYSEHALMLKEQYRMVSGEQEKVLVCFSFF